MRREQKQSVQTMEVVISPEKQVLLEDESYLIASLKAVSVHSRVELLSGAMNNPIDTPFQEFPVRVGFLLKPN